MREIKNKKISELAEVSVFFVFSARPISDVLADDSAKSKKKEKSSINKNGHSSSRSVKKKKKTNKTNNSSPRKSHRQDTEPNKGRFYRQALK